MQRLVLSRCTHVLNRSKMREKRANFPLTHRVGMPPVMEQHKPAHPIAIRSLGSLAVTPGSKPLPQALKQTNAPLRLRHPTEMRKRNPGDWNVLHPSILITSERHKNTIP